MFWEFFFVNTHNFVSESPTTQCKNEVRIWSGKPHISKWPKSGCNRWNMVNIIHIYAKQCEIMQIMFWAELRYCAELSYWAELSCWLLLVVVVQLGWRSPALLYWRRGGLEPGVEEPGGMEEEAKDISVSIFCLSVWLSVALASCHTLVVDSWHVKPFLQKNISLSYLSCIEYFFDQIFFCW